MEDCHTITYISRKQLRTRGMVSASWAYNGGFNSLSCLGLPPTRAQAFGSKDGWRQEDTGGHRRTEQNEERYYHSLDNKQTRKLEAFQGIPSYGGQFFFTRGREVIKTGSQRQGAAGPLALRGLTRSSSFLSSSFS